MITVVETKPFRSRAARLLSDEQHREVAVYIANNPTGGALMEGTGGVRKVRVPLQGRGKSGGARVIYYYHNPDMPVFLLDIFAKNEKDNLTKGERNDIRKLVKILVSTY